MHALAFSGEGAQNILSAGCSRSKFDGRLADPVRINRGRPLIRRVRAYSASDNGSRWLWQYAERQCIPRITILRTCRRARQQCHRSIRQERRSNAERIVTSACPTGLRKRSSIAAEAKGRCLRFWDHPSGVLSRAAESNQSRWGHPASHARQTTPTSRSVKSMRLWFENTIRSHPTAPPLMILGLACDAFLSRRRSFTTVRKIGIRMSRRNLNS